MIQKNNLEELKVVTRECIVLCVEDDAAGRDFLGMVLGELFKRVIFALNGLDGLAKFRENKIDLVITDQVMPLMTGLDMIKEIRSENHRMPIILMTGYAETETLAAAVNAGVTRFISKPLTIDSLLNAVETAIQGVVVENMKAMKEKMELLKYKENYHALQQKMALRKQQNIIKDDLYYKKLDTVDNNGKKSEYLINIRYQPFDVLSGDLYAVRRIDRDKILVYISDAAGKGLSAFVTASIAASFANHSIEKGILRKNFDFKAFMLDYTAFTRKQLIEDDAICVIFALIDFREEVMSIANFSMPPAFMLKEDDHVVTIAPNNLPIMRFFDDITIDEYGIRGLRKLLLCSDGLYSPEYKPHLPEDFRFAPFRNVLYRRFIENTDGPEDDITVFFLRKLDVTPLWKKDFAVRGRLSGVLELSSEIELFLTTAGLEAEFISEFIMALSEMLMNAYEHGCLSIGTREKQRLVKKGGYEEHLAVLEEGINKDIKVSISSFEESGISFLMVTVADEGEGFDTAIIKESVKDIELLHYRGIKIAKGLVDEIHYNERGNVVTFFKACRYDKADINNFEEEGAWK